MGTESTDADVRLPETPWLIDETQQMLDLLAADLDSGFAALVRSHQRIVYSVIMRAGAHPADAEDLTAQTFLRAYTALLGYDGGRIRALQPRPWLMTIALNTWRNATRDNSRRPKQVPVDRPDELPATVDNTEGVAERVADRRILSDLVARLPEAQRVAVVLRYVCDLSTVEISQVLQCPVGTVKSHIFRGLHRLRTEYALLESSGAVEPTGKATKEVAQ
jgi:RNA polymerase sigma factor (sigma-70 family)